MQSRIKKLEEVNLYSDKNTGESRNGRHVPQLTCENFPKVKWETPSRFAASRAPNAMPFCICAFGTQS